MMKDGSAATITNEEGYLPLFGILNAQGSFWTARTFLSADDATSFIWGFWGKNAAARDQCLRSHKIVPVHVAITEIVPASVDTRPKDEDATKIAASLASGAVPNEDSADAHNQSGDL